MNRLIFCLLSLLIMTTPASAETSLPPEPAALAACPDSPNCVSSLAHDERHKIQPLHFSGTMAEVWALLQQTLKGMPRVRVTEQTQHYLRAEARSRVFGFVDDIEFLLLPEQRLLHVRSAARSGYYDLGVNRRRVQTIFAALTRALSATTAPSTD